MASVPYYFGNFLMNDGVNYLLTKKTLDSSVLQYQSENIGRYPGVKFSGSRINERPIPVLVRVVGSSRNDLESKLDTLLGAMQYRQQRLTLHSSDQRYYIADCIQAQYTLAPGNVVFCDVALSFMCYLPYALAPTLSNYTMSSTALTSQGGGVYASPIQAITGGGNIFTYPQIVITNTASTSITAVTVTQQTDGMSLSVTQTMAQNDILTIFTDPLTTNGLTVTYNNGSPLAFSGAFQLMEPTLTNWQILASAASQPSISAVWTWNARWAS